MCYIQRVTAIIRMESFLSIWCICKASFPSSQSPTSYLPPIPFFQPISSPFPAISPHSKNYTVLIYFRYILSCSGAALCTLYALSVYCSSLLEIAGDCWGLRQLESLGGGSNRCAGLDPQTLSNSPKVPFPPPIFLPLIHTP